MVFTNRFYILAYQTIKPDCCGPLFKRIALSELLKQEPNFRIFINKLRIKESTIIGIFSFYFYLSVQFSVTKLLYNYKCPSVCQLSLEGNAIF